MKKTPLMACAIIFIGLSCERSPQSPQELEINLSKISIFSGDSQKIEARSDFEIAYYSNDEFHAEVTEAGIVTGVKVGNTDIEVSSDNRTEFVPVEVKAKYNTYPTPILDWSKTRSKIILSNGYPDATEDNIIGYENYAPKAPMVMYQFNDSDRLIATTVFVRSHYSEELGLYVDERYHYLGEQDELSLFADAFEFDDMEIAVATLSYDVNYWMVIYYLPSEIDKLNSTNAIHSSKIKNIILEKSN